MRVIAKHASYKKK